MLKLLPWGSSMDDARRLRDDLLAAHGAKKAQAAARLREHLPRFAEKSDGEILAAPLNVADAQLAVARERGFATWRQVEVYATHPEDASALADFLQLGCLCYFHTDRPANRERARAMLAESPDLASRDIWHAACVGDAEAVEGFLNADESLLDRRGGHFDWEPLLYACYSRLDLSGRSTLAVARCLLDRGANPNAHYMWGGQYRFTALTGAFGEGEMGPVNQPPHSEWRALAKLLLDAGANANDGQALYNTMFTPGSDCLEMLLAYGLNDEHCCNWLVAEDGELFDNEEQILGYQLEWAVRKHHVERAKLLLDHGGEFRGRRIKGRSLAELASIGGHPDLADYLVDCGSMPPLLSDEERFVGRCMAGDLEAAKEALADSPALLERAQERMPDLVAEAASANRVGAVRVMLALGFDHSTPSRTPLHQAAFQGHLEMVETLLEGGADPRLRDEDFHATPLQWALTAGHPEIAERLAAEDVDVFDAVLCEKVRRLAAILDADPKLIETTLGAMHGFEARDEDWQTPLAFAVLRGRPAAAAFLIGRGARVDDRLLRLARERASKEMVALLERRASIG